MSPEHEKEPSEEDSRPTYEPPTGLPLGDLQVGSGGIPCMNGSGVEDHCLFGFNPRLNCSVGTGVS